MIWRRAVRAVERALVYDASNQTVTVRSGPLAGLKKHGPFLDSDAAFASGVYEPEVVAALTEHCRAGATAFDVGANVGYHTMLLSGLTGEGGQVHAFEPVPATADSLERTLRLNGLENVTVHRLAAGAASGTSEMQVGAPSESGRAHIVGASPGHRAELTGSTTIEVPVRALDDLRADNTLPLPSIVKIDVEGAEPLVLLGMRDILRDGRPAIVAELWGERNIAEVEGLLASHGYRCRILSEWRGLVAGEAVTIRNVAAI
jgi:FkbM family methyltransferase